MMMLTLPSIVQFAKTDCSKLALLSCCTTLLFPRTVIMTEDSEEEDECSLLVRLVVRLLERTSLQLQSCEVEEWVL